MKEQELTPWFPPSVKPVRNGVYLRMYGDGPAYSLWDGRFWQCGVRVDHYDAVDIAAAVPHVASPSQDLKWRGLAKEPQ